MLFTIGNTFAAINNRLVKRFDPYNPLDLPLNTVRVRTNNSEVPLTDYSSYETAILVPGTTDVYDVYKSGTDFSDLLFLSNNVIEVLGANTTGITNMSRMFMSLTELTTVPLFNTTSVTNMHNMFAVCNSLTVVPLFDTSNVTIMDSMFSDCQSLIIVPLLNTAKVTSMDLMFSTCYNVESGALALYQQASTQTNPPVNHWHTFELCGSDTQTGAAELAQIPSDWK